MCRRNRSSSGTNYWFFWTERHGFEYYRHGTLSLYAALDVKSGKVTGKAAPGHTPALNSSSSSISKCHIGDQNLINKPPVNTMLCCMLPLIGTL